MSDRLFSKGLTPDEPDRSLSDRRRAIEPEEEGESERDTELLVRTRIPEALQAIGGHLDRALASLQRMERKLGDLTR